MNERWEQVAERAIEALGVRAGELIQVRDYAHRYDVLQEMLLAVEKRGATPLPQIFPTEYLQRLLATADPIHLARWDQHRMGWAETTDRVLILGGAERDLSMVPDTAREAWIGAALRLNATEARRCTPTLLMAIPSTDLAEQYGMTLEQMENLLIPALNVTPAVLQQNVDRTMGALGAGVTLTLHTGPDCVLHLQQGGRRWFTENGLIPRPDTLAPGTQAVLNMPSGSVYTTVVEEATAGRLWLPLAAGARDVTLHVEHGRIVNIEAVHGAEKLEALFDSHCGEPRRVSHIGIGLNPHLQQPMGWVLVDEHCHGAVFIAFGENRYLGGENESSLNIDFTVRDANLLAGEKVIVTEGRLMV